MTTLLTPYPVTSAPNVAGGLVGAARRAAPGTSPPPGDQPPGSVIGFGPAGRIVADQMRKSGVAIEILDLNPHLVTEARRLGFNTAVGDGQQEDVLKHIGVQAGSLVAVTVPAPEVASHIVRLVRRVSGAVVVARARYNRFLTDIENAGASGTHDEETHVGLHGAEFMKELLGTLERSGE